jgi:hypothetical protein
MSHFLDRRECGHGMSPLLVSSVFSDHEFNALPGVSHMKATYITALLVALAASAPRVHAQTGGPPPGGGRPQVGPVQNDRYHSTVVKLGGNAADGLLFEPANPGRAASVAVLYSNSSFNFDPPAAELASRGYRVLFVRHGKAGGAPSSDGSPLSGFEETSRGIAYLKTLPGVQRVVIAGWGAGAANMTLYADVAANGPSTCQVKTLLVPCRTEDAAGLTRPDGLLLFDPGLGTGSKVQNVDPAYVGDKRTRLELDRYAVANGYDARTGLATYSADFRKRYFAAQSVRNNEIIDRAQARLKQLEAEKGQGADEPFPVPGIEGSSLHAADLSIMSHTKKPHTLLKADGSRPVVVLRSIRATTGPIGEAAIAKAVSPEVAPNRVATLRQYLADDAIRSTKDFALTEDEVVGVDFKTSNAGTPAQAEHVKIPALVMTNTCFMFVVATEMVYDHLASKDKTYAGVEGSEHFFTPCKPEFGDVQKRLFDYVGEWLGKPGRF